MRKAYLVWLHDDVVAVCNNFDRALAVVGDTQGRCFPDKRPRTWLRTGDRWFTPEIEDGFRVSRLEIQMREVLR